MSNEETTLWLIREELGLHPHAGIPNPEQQRLGGAHTALLREMQHNCLPWRLGLYLCSKRAHLMSPAPLEEVHPSLWLLEKQHCSLWLQNRKGPEGFTQEWLQGTPRFPERHCKKNHKESKLCGLWRGGELSHLPRWVGTPPFPVEFMDCSACGAGRRTDWGFWSALRRVGNMRGAGILSHTFTETSCADRSESCVGLTL